MTAAQHEFDLVIIGSGPGGYTGAIKAAQNGLKVAIIEKNNTLGGTCLNVGCIPSKALLESSEHFIQANHELEEHGVEVKGVELNLGKMMERKSSVVSELTKGVQYLMDKNKVATFSGLGSFVDSNTIKVSNGDDSFTIKTKKTMIATGSVPFIPPGIEVDEKRVVSSTGALELEQVPEKLFIIGGGYIGLELGSVWNRLGSEVTVVEYGDRIAAGMDKAVGKQLHKILAKQGLKFMTNTKVEKTILMGNQIVLKTTDLKNDKSDSFTADVVLVSTGRKAFTEGLGLENTKAQVNEKNQIIVNKDLQTQDPDIFAIGDVIPGPMLAHKAEEEGVYVANIIANKEAHINYTTVPGVIYTWPEVASVGFSEEELKEQSIPYKTGKFPFSANGRAKALGCTDGFVKVIAHKETDVVLGTHVIGPRASDLIAEAVVIMEFGGTSNQMAQAFHAHPTLAEVMREAALDVNKQARQF